MTDSTQKSRGEQLATQLNLGEVLDWRLHWLNVRLESLQEKTGAKDPFATQLLRNASSALIEWVDELGTITVEFQQLQRQTMTMLGLDYFDEVQPLFDHVPKYAKFRELLVSAKDMLDAKANAASKAELAGVLMRIEAAAKTR